MLHGNPTLHLVCGKIAAGKSTLARHLAAEPATVLIGEDAWLSRLYPDEIDSVAAYVRCSARLRDVMGLHVEALLHAGLSVVLDFPANTVLARQWIRGILENTGVAHRLHYLDVSDDACKARLRARNENAEHEFAPSAADFDLITRYFVPPAPEEGFAVVTYTDGWDSPVG